MKALWWVMLGTVVGCTPAGHALERRNDAKDTEVGHAAKRQRGGAELATPKGEQTVSQNKAKDTEVRHAAKRQRGGAELATPKGEHTVLAAGLYFRRTYSSCQQCPTPTAVVVAGIDADVAVAQNRLRRRVDGLAPGYPFAAHSDELGLRGTSASGIATVLGLFETEDGARRWAKRNRAGTVYALGKPRATVKSRQVIEIDRGGPRPAYATRTATKPSCWVKPGSVHVSAVGESSAVLASETSPRAAVTCAGKPAFVAFSDTRYRATVLRASPAGGARIRQTMYVACDTPMIHEWGFVNGRKDRSRKPTIHDPEGC